MRLLHFFSETRKSEICVWPFDNYCRRKSALVEIFPTYSYAAAGCDPTKWQDRSIIDKVLTRYGSGSMKTEEVTKTKDQADALISAAAMRFFSMKPGSWSPVEMTACVKEFEGWIFGV
jgi:hypothetical protein